MSKPKVGYGTIVRLFGKLGLVKGFADGTSYSDCVHVKVHVPDSCCTGFFFEKVEHLEVVRHPTNKCPNCGGLSYGPLYCCCEECETEFNDSLGLTS